MFPGIQPASPRNNSRAATQQYLAWLLTALVLVFCCNARLSKYNGLHQDLKPTTRLADPGSAATRLGTALAGVLLLWGLSRASGPMIQAATPSPVGATPDPRRSRGGFEREFHVRPPPRW